MQMHFSESYCPLNLSQLQLSVNTSLHLQGHLQLLYKQRIVASDADAFFRKLLSFEFITAAVICQHLLAFTRPLTVALQAKNCDLLKANRMAQTLKKTLLTERENDKFHALWQSITTVANSLDVQPAKKRTTSRQQHRGNPDVSDIEGYYRVTYFYEFLDHIINHLSTRFPEELEDALIATYLLPAYITGLSADVVERIKTEFQDHLPLPSNFPNEVATWKVSISEMNLANDNKYDLLFICNYAYQNKLYFPNIYVTLSRRSQLDLVVAKGLLVV